MSSNFLAALADLRPPGAQGWLDIGFAWAARRPAPPPGTSKIYTTLSPAGYKEALDAHRDARRIRVTGTLAREGRRLVLRNPGDLVMIPGDDS